MKIRLSLTLCIVSILLAACAPNVILLSPEPEATATSMPNPHVSTIAPKPTQSRPVEIPFNPATVRNVSLTLWHGLDGETGATLSRLAAEFSQKNEWAIQVDVLSQKNLSLLVQAVGTSVRTPQQPDVVLALPENAQGWDAQGLVTDLTPYIQHSKLGLSAQDIKDIPPAFWQQAQVNKKQVSAPAMRSGRFLFYNVSFAKELGFTTPPTSAEDFREQACAANAFWKTDDDQTNDGFGGLVIENAMIDLDAPWTAYAWLRSQGSDVFTDGNFSFLTPENRASLNFLAELRADGCAWLSSATSGAEALAVRKALFVAGSLQDLPQQRAAFAGLSDEWTVIAFPGTAPAIVTYGPDFITLKSDEARQWAAWLFIRWMLAPENQVRWARETSTFPMRSSVMPQLDIRSANPQWAAAFDLLPQAKIYPQSGLWSKARLVLGDGFFQLFQLAPTANDVSQTLRMMDDTVQDLKP